MERSLLSMVSELNSLNDDNLAERVILNNDVQWCLGELQDILEVIGDMPVDRLRELAEADREGRCVVLPLKIDDEVYAISRSLGGYDYVKETKFWWSDVPEIGKTVFPTRAEAEAALRREQNG